MADLWNRYETVLLFNPELGAEATEELVQRARSFVTDETGRLLKTDRWGLKQTAFEVKGHPKAYYLLLEFAGPVRASQELERRLNLIDDILKFQTIRLEERIDVTTLPEEEEDLGRAEPQATPSSPEAEPDTEVEVPAEAPEPEAETAPAEEASETPADEPAAEKKAE